jgi:hypothetical protein
MQPTASSDAPQGPAGPGRWLARLFLVVTCVLCAWGIWVVRWDSNRMPSQEVFSLAAARIQQGWQDGDVIRTLPLWNDNQRVGLDGHPFLLSTEPDEYDRHLYRRMWLAWPRSHSGDAQADLAMTWLPGFTTVSEEGGYRVVLGDIVQTHEVLFDGYEQLAEARVSQARMDGEPQACEIWDDARWQCGRRDDFIYVGQTIREIDDTFRRCITANPPPDQKTWVVEWDDVPLEGQLRVRAGITLWAFRHERGSGVLFRVLVDGVEVVSRTFEPREIGYPEFVVELDGLSAERSTIRVEVSATDHMDRFFCFRPQVVVPLAAR